MHSKQSVFQLFLFLSAISLSSCFAPQKVIQMESGEDEAIKWNYGREVVHVKNGDLEARIFFEDFTKKDLIFDVEVVNLGEEEILLLPEQIHLLTDHGGKAWAFDPEKEIFGEQMELSRREAAGKNAAVAIGVIAVAAVVTAAVASDGDNSDNDNDIDFDGGTFVYVNTAVPPPPLAYMPPNVNFWKDYSLRKTTLDKGYKVGGKVVFPRMDDVREFTIVVPVGDVELKANFRQKIFQP